MAEYTNYPYQNSAAYHAVMGANLAQILTRRPYTENAVRFHLAEGNAGQVVFYG